MSHIWSLCLLQQRFKQDPQSPTSREAMAEISKYGSLGDFAFFDKVRSIFGMFFLLTISDDSVINFYCGL